jgi:hypothetical protein
MQKGAWSGNPDKKKLGEHWVEAKWEKTLESNRKEHGAGTHKNWENTRFVSETQKSVDI